MPLEDSTLPIGTVLRERYLIKNVPGSGDTGIAATELPPAAVQKEVTVLSPAAIVATPVTPPKLAQTQSNRLLPKKRQSSAILLKVAITCAILLLLISAGAGLWTSIRNQFSRASTAQQESAFPSPTSVSSSLPASSPVAQTTASNYPHMPGHYVGILSPLDAPTGDFSLVIKQQQSLISGTFSSPQQKGNFSGTVDAADDVQFTVENDGGVTVYIFSGGLNGSPQLTDSMGGIFYSCSSASSSNCQAGSHLSGTWSLNHQA